MKVALVSLNQQWRKRDENFLRCEEFVREARTNGAELVVFPEMTLTGFSLEIAGVVEPEKHSPTMTRFGNLAKESGATIVFGACLQGESKVRPQNQLCVALPSGTSRSIYGKIHLFSFAGEHEVFGAGEFLGTAQIGSLVFGTSVCYDLRFPELFAAMATDCHAVTVIANWPMERIAHWRTLLTALAIENQFYVIGVNRTGVDGKGLRYSKSTMVVGPDGEILASYFRTEEMDIYELDAEMPARCRSEFPTLRDERHSLYGTLARSP